MQERQKRERNVETERKGGERGKEMEEEREGEIIKRGVKWAFKSVACILA